jgi:hypothetical protein
MEDFFDSDGEEVKVKDEKPKEEVKVEPVA